MKTALVVLLAALLAMPVHASGWIALLKNTAEGISIVARAIDFRPGDRIISAEGEYPANIYPWMDACRRSGAELVLVPETADDAGRRSVSLDAILADAPRAAHIDAIDQRYWQYLPDGTLFAPHTDGEKAFREDRTAAFGKDLIPHGTPELVYKQIREYRDRFPEKMVLTHHAGHGPIPILMAGAYPLLNDFAAAQPLKIDRDDRALFAFLREHAADLLPALTPAPELAHGAWVLADANRRTVLLYSQSGETVRLTEPLPKPQRLALWFNPASGKTQPAILDASDSLKKPSSDPWVLMVR